MDGMDRDMDAQGFAHTQSSGAAERGRSAPPPADDFFVPLTPGLIVSSLSPARALEVGLLYEEAIGREHADNAARCRALLRVLNDQELRRIAKVVGMPTEGQFLSLYHRLALVC